MEDLVVKSTSFVHPSNNDTVNQSDRVRKIHLTPWDLMFLRFSYPQRGLFFPKPKEEIDAVFSKLQASLSIALNHFYPLAGCLVKQVNENDETVSFYISCDGGSSGVKFVHAEAKNIAMTDLVKSGFIDDTFFFPATGIKNYQGVSNPLLMVQVTEIKDAVFIGFGFNHMVADGKSIWKFINLWSEICRCLDSRNELTLKGWFLDRIDYPIRIQETEENVYVLSTSTTLEILQEIVFRLTKENVSRLKAKANSEVGFEEGKDRKISSFQAVLGHIWRSRVKNGGMRREEETVFRIPIDMRQRLNPKLDEECFGNVIQFGLVKANVGEMLDRGLGWIAIEINEMIKRQTDENAKGFAESWVKNVEIPVSLSNTLLVASSPRFDVYGNDFGWGKPIGLRSGPPFSNGKLVVVQGVEEGGFEFQASFTPQVVAKLVNDAEFLEYVDIVS